MTSPLIIPLEDGGELLYFEQWLPQAVAQAYHEALLREVPWEQKHIVIMGKRVLQPRLVAWFGEPEAVYTYSGVRNVPLPWIPALQEIRALAQEAAGHAFNSVLANLYRDGNDSMGFHADNEKELGRNPVIASVSLGAERRFQLRYVGKQKKVPGRDFLLPGGSLLVMRGTTQHFWRHGVPKEKGGGGPRINLTFRRILG